MATVHTTVLLLAALAVLATAPAHVLADPFTSPKDHTSISGPAYGKCTNYGGPFDGVAPGVGSFGLTVGGCGYGDINSAAVYPYRHAIAFDPSAPAIAGLPSFGCGSCWRVTNLAPGGGSVVAMVTDICPGCASKFGSPNHIDMHYDTWTLIAGSAESAGGGGIFDMVTERVSCQAPESAAVKIMDARGSFGWLRLSVANAAGYGTITGVSINCPSTINFGGTPQSDPTKYLAVLKNTWGNIFEVSEIPLYAPGSSCLLVITSEGGATLTSAPLNLDLYKGEGVDKWVDLGTNFPPAVPPTSTIVTAGRKLLTSE